MEINKNERTAELVGLCYGDGSLTTRKDGKHIGELRFQIRGNITEDREHYDNYVKPLIDHAIGAIQITEYKRITPYYGLTTQNVKICNYLKLLGVPVGVKTELVIPSWILKNRLFKIGFVRGFVDTEGSVFATKDSKGQHTRIRMSIINTSKIIVAQISQILKELGVKNIIVKPYIRKKPLRDAYKIQIADSNVEKYFSVIGSHNPKHSTKYELWKLSGYCMPHTTMKERKSMLAGIEISNHKKNDWCAGVAEPGQMRSLEVAIP
jgi:hypothetical protein